jgi:hypothetical protein
MGELNEEGKTHFGNLTTFYSLLYTGAGVFFIGLILIFTDTPEFGLIFILVASILIIITFVIFYIILYRIWKFVIEKEHKLGMTPSIPTAGQAVGFLFIPLFNIYWIFRALGKLPVEINLVAKRYDVQKTVQDNLGYIIGILALIGFIPIVGYVTGAINFLILLPLFLKNCVEVCELIETSEVAPDVITEVIRTEKIEWESIKEFSSLFDKENFGVNFFVGIALFISLIIIRVLRMSLIGSYDGFSIPELDYLLNGVAFDLVISILFIFTCQLVTKNWAQPFVWGTVVVALYLFRSIIIMNAQTLPGEEIIQIPSLQIERILKDFIWGFAFMFGLVFAVNVWGPKVWSLIIGLASSYIVYKALFIALEYGPSPVDLDFKYLFSGADLINFFGRIITALLIYGALFLHFDNLQTTKQFREP